MVSTVVHLLLERVEDFAAGYAAWVAASFDEEGVDLLDQGHVHLDGTDQRGPVPDVVEGYLGEVAAPVDGDADSEQCAGNDVAEGLPEVEALVRALPHAVDTVGVVGFTQDFLEGHLQMVIEVVWIAVAQIGLGGPRVSDHSHDG